jgi:acetylxylan esterase
MSSGALGYELLNIPDFGDNPSDLIMDVYIPPYLPASPTLVLALHGCGSSGPAYAEAKGYPAVAEEKSFIVIFPSTTKDSKCWDVHSEASLTRDGGGDSTGLANMLRYAIATWDVDPNSIYLTGISSGGMMSNVMIAAYPDFFQAAVCYMGMPAGCLKGSPGSSPITASPECLSGNSNLTAEEWAQRARDIYPGYDGAYPRFKTLHGTLDPILNIALLDQELLQWSTLMGVELTAINPDKPYPNYTELVYGDGTQLVGYSGEGVGHTVAVDLALDMEWFGL